MTSCSRYANELICIRAIPFEMTTFRFVCSGDYANELICIPRTWEYMESKPCIKEAVCRTVLSDSGAMWRYGSCGS